MYRIVTKEALKPTVILYEIEAPMVARKAQPGQFIILRVARAFRSGSHRGRGWEEFSDAVIRRLNERRDHLVFLLWGAAAQQKAALIDPERHLVLTAAPPSPRSADRGFFGCRHFSRANAYLRAHGIPEIEW